MDILKSSHNKNSAHTLEITLPHSWNYWSFLFFYFQTFTEPEVHISHVFDFLVIEWIYTTDMNIKKYFVFESYVSLEPLSSSSSSSCIFHTFFSALLFTRSTWQEVSKTITWNIYTACAFLELWRWHVNQNQHFLSLTSFSALQLRLCLSITFGWETWKCMYFIIRNAICTHKKPYMLWSACFDTLKMTSVWLVSAAGKPGRKSARGVVVICKRRVFIWQREWKVHIVFIVNFWCRRCIHIHRKCTILSFLLAVNQWQQTAAFTERSLHTNRTRWRQTLLCVCSCQSHEYCSMIELLEKKKILYSTSYTAHHWHKESALLIKTLWSLQIMMYI